MGWEYRKGKPYYYRKQRHGNKVVSTYCGSADSDIAKLWSSIDQLDRERRQQEATERQIERSEFQTLAAPPPELAELLTETRRQTAEALTAVGYHQHKRGEWRKRRD